MRTNCFKIIILCCISPFLGCCQYFNIIADYNQGLQQNIHQFSVALAESIIVIGEKQDTLSRRSIPFIARYNYSGELVESKNLHLDVPNYYINLGVRKPLWKTNQSIFFSTYLFPDSVGNDIFHAILEIDVQDLSVHRFKLFDISEMGISLRYYDNYPNKGVVCCFSNEDIDDRYIRIVTLDENLDVINNVKFTSKELRTANYINTINKDSFEIVGLCFPYIDADPWNTYSYIYRASIDIDSEKITYDSITKPGHMGLGFNHAESYTVLKKGRNYIIGAVRPFVYDNSFKYYPLIFEANNDFNKITWENYFFYTDSSKAGEAFFNYTSFNRDSSYILGVGQQTKSNDSIFYFQISEDGNWRWFKNYLPGNFKKEEIVFVEAHQIIPSPKGGAIITGYVSERGFGYRGFLTHIDDNGCYSSDCISANTALQLSVDIKIFPNPVESNYFLIKLSDEEIILDDIKVFNAEGLLLNSKYTVHLNREIHVELPDQLNSGVYLVELRTRSGHVTVKKFVVQSN